VNARVEDLERIGCIAVASAFQIHRRYIDRRITTRKDGVSARNKMLVGKVLQQN